MASRKFPGNRCTVHGRTVEGFEHDLTGDEVDLGMNLGKNREFQLFYRGSRDEPVQEQTVIRKSYKVLNFRVPTQTHGGHFLTVDFRVHRCLGEKDVVLLRSRRLDCPHLRCRYLHCLRYPQI